MKCCLIRFISKWNIRKVKLTKNSHCRKWILLCTVSKIYTVTFQIQTFFLSPCNFGNVRCTRQYVIHTCKCLSISRISQSSAKIQLLKTEKKMSTLVHAQTRVKCYIASKPLRSLYCLHDLYSRHVTWAA